MQAYLVENGGQMRTRDLEATMRNGQGLPGIWLTLRRAKLTLPGFLRTFRNIFKVARGVVTLVDAPGPAPGTAPDAAPVPAPDAAPDPAPGPAPEPTLEERMRAIQERQEERRREREAASRARLRNLPAVYGARS